MISGVSSHYDLKCYIFMAPGLTKDPSLGTLFEHVHPQDDGSFELEIGVNLPDLFPNLEGKPEYILDVAIDKRGKRPVCLSNVMARLRFEKEGQSLHALIPRRALTKVREGQVEFIPVGATVELLRTFAACRYQIAGGSAEEALETHLEDCIHDFLERLSRLLRMMPFADQLPGRVYSIAYSRATFDAFYFIIKGCHESELGHGRISPHFGRAMLNPPDLTADQATLLRDLLCRVKSPDDIQSLLHAAQCFLDGGVMEYVLLLSVIAAEVATQRFVHKKLLALGVSKTKLKEAGKDLTYDMMLNLVLFSVTPEPRKPDKNLIGRLNRARGLRNEYMHYGKQPENKNEIINILEDTKKYVRYLDEIAECDLHSTQILV